MKLNLKMRREQSKRQIIESASAAADDEEVKEDTKQPESKIVRDYLASGSRDKSIKIWEVKNARCVLSLIGHDNWITDLCFHPSGRYLLSVSDDKSLRCWDLQTGRCAKKLYNIHSHFVTTIAMKQKSVLTGSVDQTLKVWNCR